jgi:GT2 family glycosyltransferase
MEFHIAGPDIESLVDHRHQNPKKDTISDLKKARQEIWRYRLLYILSRLGLYDWFKGKGPMKDVNRALAIAPNEVQENVILHGSFVVFSPKFIENEDFCFRPGTFLYMEEAILYRYGKCKGYKMVFTPLAKVYHKEDSSTNTLFNANKQKREFVFKNMIRSLKVYCKVLVQ